MIKFFEKLKDVDDLAEENIQIRRGKKFVEKELKKARQELSDNKDEIIKLLTEKGEGFDQYLKYESKYEEYYNLSKENKKEIAELKSELKKCHSLIEEKDEIIAKLERKVKRLDKVNSKKELAENNELTENEE